MKSISDLDLRGHQIKNVLIENIAAADLPDAALNGSRIVYDTTNKRLLYSNGTEWRDLSKADIKYKSNGVITVDGVDITVFQIATSGDVTMNASNQAIIGTNKVSNTKLAKMRAKTLKGNNTSSTANADDLTVAEVLEMLGIDLESLNGKVDDVKVDGQSVVDDSNVALISFDPLKVTVEKSGNSYILKQGGVSLGVTIDIPKDMVVESGKIVSGTWQDGEFTPGTGTGKALALTIANGGNIVYIDVAYLVDAYTGGSTATITVNISATNEITATINNGSIAEIHLATALANKINAKQDTNVTLTVATDSGINTLPTTGTTKTVTQWFQLVVNYLKSLTHLFNTHTHNGTDAPKVSYNDLTDKPTIPEEYELPVATSTTLGGVKSGTDITVDGSGNVSVKDNSHKHTTDNITGLATVAETGSYNDLVDKPDIPKTYKTAALAGTSGTILATTHNCGKNPQVQAYLSGELVICDIKISADGNVTWTAGEAFVAGADFRLVIQG